MADFLVKAREWRDGENPARWRGHLAKLLPARSKLASVEHHTALPWSETREFMPLLQSRPGIAAMALRFCILTAARSGEVRGATWAEIDMHAGSWTIPGVRMKAGREHRVPLSNAALEILAAVAPLRKAATDPLFPSPQKRAAQLSDMTMAAVLKRMGRNDLTVHGFRSTFRDWTAEMTTYSREIAEEALAHTIGGVEAAYRRSDLYEKRARLMQAWADHCDRGVAAAEVVPIRAAG